MAQPIYPQNGARFHIDLVENTPTSAQYQVHIYVADGFYSWQIQIFVDSPDTQWQQEVSPNPPTHPMPPWMKKHTESLLRNFVQTAKREGTWGRRIRRWRDATDTTSA